MIGLILLITMCDTLKYDDGTAEGFYIIGEYENDKLGVKFSSPYPYYRVKGVLVFANSGTGFTNGSLCISEDDTPDTINSLIELDSVYSLKNGWMFTPIDIEIKDTLPIWFILRTSLSPAVGGDTDTVSGNSWYYSDSLRWRRASYNWLVRLVVQEIRGYYENFSTSPTGYTGDWEFGVPSIITVPPKDNCFGTRLDTLYPNNTYLQLESPWIFVKNYSFSNPMLIFKHFYSTQFLYDGGNVKITKDNMRWDLITPLRGYDVKLEGAVGVDGELGFSGSSQGWRKECFLLPLYDSLKIRWCFGSDVMGNREGWFIDEVKIIDELPHDVSPILTNLRKLVSPDTTIVITTKVKNLGIYSAALFTVSCVIESCGMKVYDDVQLINSLDPESTVTLNFTPWKTGNEGVIYHSKIYTQMPQDERQSNDTIYTEFITFQIRDQIMAGFVDTSPIIDGIIDSVEWRNSIEIDGSDVLGVDSVDLPQACKLYFMNSKSTLFIGCKAQDIREIKIYIDETSNGKWDTNGREGVYQITLYRYQFQDMYYHNVYLLPDSLRAISSQGIELGIPIGNELYEIMTRDSIRCFVQVRTHTGYVGWWPQYIYLENYNNPIYYATIKITGVGVEEGSSKFKVQSLKFKVYPNPFVYSAIVKFESSGVQELESIKIYDLAGRIVEDIKYQKSNIKIGEKLSAGIYFLKIRIGEKEWMKKIVKMK